MHPAPVRRDPRSRPIRSRTFPLAILTAVFVLAAVAPAAARNPMAIGVSTPGSRAPEHVEAAVNAFEQSIGGPDHRPATWSLWSQWGHGYPPDGSGCAASGRCSFPTAAVAKLHDMGVTPVIWWEPIDPQNTNSPRFSYEKILAGRHDAYIRDWAEAAHEAGVESGGRDIILRFAHEANGFWFPWGMGRFTNTPKNFKRAWRHVWRIFEQEDALDDVDFLWSVSKQKCPSCNPFAQVYPGDRYVDYAGVTAFNWGRWHGRTWQSMMRVLADPIRDIQRVTPRPIVIAETASHFRGGDKAGWLRSGYQKIYDTFPRVKAILYLNTNEPNVQQDHPDWRLVKPNNGTALVAYESIAEKPRFQGAIN